MKIFWKNWTVKILIKESITSFPIELSSTRARLSYQTLLEETKPMVGEKYEIEYQQKSTTWKKNYDSLDSLDFDAKNQRVENWIE